MQVAARGAQVGGKSTIRTVRTTSTAWKSTGTRRRSGVHSRVTSTAWSLFDDDVEGLLLGAPRGAVLSRRTTSSTSTTSRPWRRADNGNVPTATSCLCCNAAAAPPASAHPRPLEHTTAPPPSGSFTSVRPCGESCRCTRTVPRPAPPSRVLSERFRKLDRRVLSLRDATARRALLDTNTTQR